MAALTDAGAQRVGDWLTAQTAGAIPPVAPLMIALLTVAGDDINPGTEVPNTGGYQRQIFSPTPTTTAGGVTSVRNVNLIRFENMPQVTVVGLAVWDSGNPAFRWFHGTLTTPRAFDAGDPAELGIGDLVLVLD